MNVSTDKPIVITTLGALWRQAKAAGKEMTSPGTYMIQVDGDKLWLDKVGTEQKTTAMTVRELCKLAEAAGVKPRKDDQGRPYLTLNIDPNTKKAWIDVPTDKDMKTGKAISPKREKK